MNIEITQTCFGQSINVNGKPIHVDTQNYTKDRSDELIARTILLDKLGVLIAELDSNDFALIAEIVANRGGFDLVEYRSSKDPCECCDTYYEYKKYTEYN